MPATNQITIQPADLQQIIEKLSALQWSTGPVVIKEYGSFYLLRDINEGHIASINKTLDKDG